MIHYLKKLLKSITQRKDCDAKKDKGAKSKLAELRQQCKGVTWGKGMSTRKAIEEGRRR
jgi:hypothetical protein